MHSIAKPIPRAESSTVLSLLESPTLGHLQLLFHTILSPLVHSFVLSSTIANKQCQKLPKHLYSKLQLLWLLALLLLFRYGAFQSFASKLVLL